MKPEEKSKPVEQVAYNNDDYGGESTDAGE